ncbi:protein HEADING DATE 3B-like [Zingiber officinale]|uniref:protein HEADING DATE 3B-like n=1 Tax=Zingiber officinale TaxID=94328 RepID=UPI001C4B138C|nr:protein HEADING DATE 3B-like [Zingiber officinale]
MKGVEEDKITGPLFPRLHVNDTHKGGPKAAPRNKMVLYEQLSIPSQRFNSSSSTMPFPPCHFNNSVPSLSSSQGCGQQRKMLSPFRMTSQMPVHAAEKAGTSDGMNLVGKRMELYRKSIKQVSSENLFGTGLVAEYRSQRQEDPSMKIPCENVLDDAEDTDVRTFDQLESVAFLKKDTHMTSPMLTASISHKLQKSLTSDNYLYRGLNLDQKPLEETYIAEVSCSQSTHMKDLKETSPIEKTKETKQKSPCNEMTDLRNSSKDSAVRIDTNNFHLVEKFMNEKTGLCQENGDQGNFHTLNGIAICNGGKSSEAKSELYLNLSPRKNPRTSNLSKNCFNEDNPKKKGSLVFDDVERQDDDDDAYEPSMAGTESSLDISPYDIIAVIGTKPFVKARRAIVNQQRVLGIQVSELHRLIKVQKLIAASPHLLLEANSSLSKPSVKTRHDTKSLQYNRNSQSVEFKRLDELCKTNHNVEQPMEDGISGVPVLPACVDGSKRGPQDQVPNIRAHSVMPSAVQISSDQMTNPWCFSPLANRWLVPVMSQSDGLVYKPYSRHCPPPNGFMPPLYGGCNPLGVSPPSRDFINAAHAVPVSHQLPNMVLPGQPTMSSPYFPIPYSFPPSNPIITSSTVEQASNLSSSQVNGKTGQLSRRSHNMLHHLRKDALVGNPRKFQLSKKSELQGSTASSPSEKANPENRCPVPPLPAAPAASKDSQTRIIKVVPHNARSATESAARIFQSIQEER